jgi:hypothetical protein
MNKILGFMKSPRCTDIIIDILLVFVLLTLGVILFWELYPYKVLTPREGNYSLEKLEYKQGESFPIKFNLCKNLDFEEDVYGRFIDGVIYSVPENSSNFDTGCYDSYITSVSIPETLPPGIYTYEETIIYRVNPLKTIEYTFITPEFKIVE